MGILESIDLRVEGLPDAIAFDLPFAAAKADSLRVGVGFEVEEFLVLADVVENCRS